MAQTDDLAGKVAVVTGGSSGIGDATVQLLRSRGVTVSNWDVNPPRHPSPEDQGPARYIHTDVTDSKALVAAAEAVERELGGIDFLINVAGGGTAQTIDSMAIEDWDAVVALNLSGPLYAIKACVGSMRRRGGGRIVIISSVAALRMSMSVGASYTAAKAGLLGLTRHAAFEYARDNILVNTIMPGPVMTPMMAEQAAPEAVAFATKVAPFGRFQTPEEIAQPVLFFCTAQSSGCTGAALLVDGGISIGFASPELYFQTHM